MTGPVHTRDIRHGNRGHAVPGAFIPWHGRELVDELARNHILIRSPGLRGVAEEAPGAYKDVTRVADVAERAGLARRIAR